MNDKLLRAFIEAQGFEVKEIVDTKETPIPRRSGLAVHHNLAVDNQGAYKRGEDECYYLKASMEVDYKLTKREDTALSLLREIVKGDHDYVNEYNLGVDLFKRIKELTDENNT